jgi:hypothetical protein
MPRAYGGASALSCSARVLVVEHRQGHVAVAVLGKVPELPGDLGSVGVRNAFTAVRRGGVEGPGRNHIPILEGRGRLQGVAVRIQRDPLVFGLAEIELE